MKINKEKSLIKKVFMAGLLAGLVFAVYSNLTDCHPQILGAGVEACDNKLEIWLGMFEFLIYFPIAALFGFLGLGYLFGPDCGFQILITLSPVVVFSLIGLIVGLILSKIVKSLNNKH